MENQTPQPEKRGRKGPPLTLIGIATLGFLLVREYLLYNYPEIYSMVCSTSIALVGVGIALKATRPILNAIKEARESKIEYFAEHPEEKPEAIKASKKLIKDEKANYKAMLDVLKIALDQAKKNNDKKLSKHYSELIEKTKRQFRLKK